MKLTRTQLQNLLIEQVLFSEGLRYHVENSIPLYDCIYRPGSKGFFSLISESRKMYNNGLLCVDEDELDMLNSDLGEFALYEGREVALDFPISESADYSLMNESIQDIALAYRSYLENNFEFYDHGEGHLNCAWTAAHFKDWANMNGLDPSKVGVFYFVEQPGQNLSHIAPTYDDFIIDPTIRQFDPNELPVRVTHIKDYRATYRRFGYGQGVVHDYIKAAGFQCDYIYDTIDGLLNKISWKLTIFPPARKQQQLNEKKRRKRRKKKKSKAKKSGSYYRGRKVKLNKPARNSGSGGKFVVYVRNQKTGNIKRITFGARGMTTGLRNSARRKSFAARHRCAQKKDKLAPGYWACRIGRYPAVSGAPYTTWW